MSRIKGGNDIEPKKNSKLFRVNIGLDVRQYVKLLHFADTEYNGDKSLAIKKLIDKTL